MVEQHVEIHTDGSCLGNPGPGGWGAVLQLGDYVREFSGGEAETTNNRMEMTAAIRALEALKRPMPVRIHTDSTYVRNGITKWVVNWKRNGWQTKDKQPVKNVDLWQQLDVLVAQHNPEWIWVKGHAGNEGNERADRLARAAAEQVAGH